MPAEKNDATPTNQKTNAEAQIEPVRRRLAPLICTCAVLVVHFCVLMSRFAPAICSPDANGYWAQGSLLFTTGRAWFKPESDVQYLGMHWLVTDSGRYFSRYPPGLAVAAGLVYRVFGYKASVLVNPVLATLTLAGGCLLIARLLGGWWAAAGALVLAANPSFNEHALACDSHVAVACCLAWGLYFLVRWSQRGKLWEAFVAGLLLGCIPTIRYPEALFGLGVGVFLLMHARERKRIWLHWLVAAAGAALPLVPLMIRNQLAFGAFYRTAYALTQEQTGFGWGYFKSHFVQYVRNLNGDGVGLFFSLGVVGIAVMCCARRARRLGVLLAALAVPSTLLYMAYYWAPGRMAHSTMRFLIPTFICYAVAGLWLLAVVTDRLSPVRKLCVVGLALVLHLIWGVPESLEHTQRLHYQKQLLAQVTDALEEHTEAGDVILADNQLLQHLDFVRKWRLADPSALRPRPPRMLQRMEQDKDAPKPMQEEKLAQMAQKYEGLLPPEQELEAAKALSKWAGERKVYFVGPEYALEQMRGLMFNAECFKIVGRIKLPEPPPMEGPEGPMGRRAGRGRVAGPDRPGGEPDLPAPPGGGAMPPGAGVRGMPPGAGGVPPAGGRMGQRIHAYTREYVIAEWTYDPKRARRRRGPGQFLDEHLPRPWRRTPRFRDRQRR